MQESQFDPTGKTLHEAGAKADGGKTRLGLVLGGFARALEAVGQIGTFGAGKYTDNGWMTVPNGVSRYTDALHRHLLAEARGEIFDPETHLAHAAHAAWNALARLDLMIREQEKQMPLLVPYEFNGPAMRDQGLRPTVDRSWERGHGSQSRC